MTKPATFGPPILTLTAAPIARVHLAGAIRAYRTAQQLSQQEFADELHTLARRYLPSGIGLDRQMVSKWERGTKGASRLYRQLIAQLIADNPVPATPPVYRPDTAPVTVGYNSRLYPHRFGTARTLAVTQ